VKIFNGFILTVESFCNVFMAVKYKEKAQSLTPILEIGEGIYLILPASIWPWGSTQPLTEMSTRHLPGGKGRPTIKAEILTAICEMIV
jgi:hypothetical protein